MKKLALFFYSIVVVAWLGITVAPLASAQTARFCDPGWTLSRDGSTCTSPTGEKKASNVSPSPTPTPPSPTPAPPQRTGSSGGSALPECTDNFDNPQICLPKGPGTGLAGTRSVVDLAAKIINILLYLAGVIAVIFVIIGGYRYMTAAGNEEAANKGRKTLTQAIIGLVIIILAYAIVTAVTNFLIK